jgi:hypothetical protein
MEIENFLLIIYLMPEIFKNRCLFFFELQKKMTTTDILASAAITLSLAATLICLITLPMVFQKITTVKTDLTVGMHEFHSITGDTWDRMITIRQTKIHKRQAPDAYGVPSTPAPQQPGHCHCYDREYFCCFFW